MLAVKERLAKIADARSLTQVIVDTVREPLLVLDGDLKILFASDSFHRTFRIAHEDMVDQHLFAFDKGAWNIPGLRTLLEQTKPDRSVVEGFEVAYEFPRIGRRIMLLCARKARFENDSRTAILLSFGDMTERREIELDKEHLQTKTDQLLHQKEMLLQEMQHRVLNSLQIIASILMLKARAVTSEETRQHLQDAHRRVMSVAAVQRHLNESGSTDLIEIAPYLSKLCASLAESMIGESRSIALEIVSDEGNLVSGDTISLGLIVTELVINALKYAFPEEKASAVVKVRYEVSGSDWKLSVSDNGVGRVEDSGTKAKGGLGTSLVKALAQQLEAQVETVSSPDGVTVSVTHATPIPQSPAPAV